MVLLCATGKVHPEYRHAFDNLLNSDLHWPSILETSLRKQVLVNVSDCLQSRDAVPAVFKRTAVFHDLEITAATAKLKKAFEDVFPMIIRSNRVVLLRGIANAYTVHRTKAVRKPGDLDLLIDQPFSVPLAVAFPIISTFPRTW